MENDFNLILGYILPISLETAHKTLMGFCYISYLYLLLGIFGLLCLNFLKYEHKAVDIFNRMYLVAVIAISAFYLYSVYALVLPPQLVAQYQDLQSYAKSGVLAHMVIPYTLGVLLGMLLWMVFLRYVVLFLERVANYFASSNFNIIKSTVDIYKVRDKKGVASYDPRKYFKIDQGLIFLGWNAELNEPIYEEYETFVKKHVQALGRSQSGKNLALQPIAMQMLMSNSFVIMLDVKLAGGDDIMAPMLYQAAQDLNLPYTYMEFGMDAPAQMNILDSKDTDTLYDIIIQLSNMQETSDMATDFYQQQGKKLISEITRFVTQSEEAITINEIIKQYGFLLFPQKVKDENKSKVQTTLEVLADWKCINANDAAMPTIRSLIDNGGVWYIQAQNRMSYVIIQAIIAIIQKLPNKSRKICLIADEFFKYVNHNMIEIFTEGGGKGIQCLVAYQTASLLKASQLGITSQDMIGTLFANCSYSYIYGSNDPFIFEQVKQTSGTINVDVESKSASRNIAIIDKQTADKTYSSQLAPKVTPDLLNLLKDRENYLIFAGRPTYLTHTGRIPVMKGEFNKDSPEFKQISNEARTLTYRFEVTAKGYDILNKGSQENPSHEYNPFD